MKKRLIVLACIFVLAIGALAVYKALPPAPVRWMPPEQGDWETTLSVAADMDYQPFSFFDETGQPAGHDVELIYALGQQLQVKIDLHLVPWNNALSGLQSGKYDLLLGVSYAPERLNSMLLSCPTISDPYFAFGRSDEAFSVSSLSSGRLCTIAGDSVNEAFLIPYGLTGNTVYEETYTACFAQLKAGTCDYVIAPYTTGRQLISTLNVQGAKAVSSALYNSIFCLAAPLGKEALIDQVNDALAELSANGTLDQIYDRWLIRYTNVAPLSTFLEANWAYVLIGLLVLILGFFSVLYLVERSNFRKVYIATERGRIFEEILSDPLMEYEPGTDRLTFIYKDDHAQMHRARCEHYFSRHLYDERIAPEFRDSYRGLLSGETLSGAGGVLEYRACLGAGEWGWYRATVSAVRDGGGKILRVLARLEDITAEVARRNETLQLTSTDRLTGLLNRDAFLQAAGGRLDAGSGSCALIMLDIDDFKSVNDRWGHAAGDEALRSVALQLGRALAPDDLIGRFGGDEFLAFMDCADREIVEKRLNQCRTLLRQTDQPGRPPLTCSFGVVLCAGSAVPLSRLMELADAAMYDAKQNGKDQLSFRQAEA